MWLRGDNKCGCDINVFFFSFIFCCWFALILFCTENCNDTPFDTPFASKFIKFDENQRSIYDKMFRRRMQSFLNINLIFFLSIPLSIRSFFLFFFFIFNLSRCGVSICAHTKCGFVAFFISRISFSVFFFSIFFLVYLITTWSQNQQNVRQDVFNYKTLFKRNEK